jgi:starvation-inducible outer membrane lipoprotein
MKTMKKEFIRSGFHHEQLKRVGKVAIYKRHKVDQTDYHYEVVKISRHNGYKMGGAYIDPAETYPGASLWGIQAWTCTDLQRAEMHFATACIRFNKKKKELEYA